MDLSFVVRIANRGPDRRSQIRVIEMPPATGEILSARTSQGACTVTTILTCEIGSLAPGSDAVVIVTVRATTEGDLISTALASGSSDNRLTNESHATSTTTRVVRHAPALALRRPVIDTLFRLGRNNTVQWTLRGVPGGVSVDLSRDDGATWTRLSNQAENVGFYDWTGVGATTSRAKIRVTSLANPALTQTSPSFSIVAR